MFDHLKPLDFVIKSERLQLRPLAVADMELIFEIFEKNPRIHRFLGRSPAIRKNDYQVAIRDFPGTDLIWVIERNSEIIGSIALKCIAWEKNWIERNGEVAFWLDPKHEGRGYMTEAVEVLKIWAFDKAGFHKLLVNHISQNEASRKIIERTGFRLVGENKQHFKRFGRWWDHTQYELLAEEWRDLDQAVTEKQNRFFRWNQEKTRLDVSAPSILFEEGDVWMCHVGVNIGKESMGKGFAFLRPLLVFKKINHHSFWGLPLTSVPHEGLFYEALKVKDKLSYANLAQIKLIDSKRLKYRMGKASPKKLRVLREKFKQLL